MEKYPFTPEEWEICLKVLETLKENPFDNPDNQRLKTLITAIHKKAKKEIRKEEYEVKKQEDTAKIQQTIIISKAQENTTLYAHEYKPKNQEFQNLHIPKSCYACGVEYTKLHFFYHKLCPECSELNYKFRQLEANFENYQVILTGGRVKIGYATALKFLRSKANVLLTTRFPAIALEQFSKEPDFEVWKNNLVVYGLDLRNMKSVYQFVEYCKDNLKSLDILINNAAQTIRYTPEYYQPLIEHEQRQLALLQNSKLLPNQTPIHTEFSKEQLPSFLELEKTQMNRFGQPIDYREKNSWNSTLEEIGLEELLEVNFINHISPYILISELKPLMLQSIHKEKYIINVTSSEGQFSYMNKTIFHPHTNMTKAALNMLTRTSAGDFVKNNIYMNAVDVGWISTGANEEKRNRLFENLQIPPLDSVDGAMRIIQPILDIRDGNTELYGKLLKNYQIVEW
jgi:NAD(P)-dependent dehydrogenase (short-subunit alcohol dehydrogenase family)